MLFRSLHLLTAAQSVAPLPDVRGSQGGGGRKKRLLATVNGGCFQTNTCWPSIPCFIKKKASSKSVSYSGCFLTNTCKPITKVCRGADLHLHPSNIAAPREPIIRQNQTKGFPEIKHLAANICQLSSHYTLHQAPPNTGTQQAGSATTTPEIHQPRLARHKTEKSLPQKKDLQPVQIERTE